MTYKDFAARYIGTRAGSKQHRSIVDGYNRITPLPDGYRLQYTDAWCAGFASYVLYSCGAVNGPYSVSVYQMKHKAQANKQIAKTPRVNDLILYNWNGDGVPDHVGIISEISGGTLSVIEGNMSRSVGVRKISKGSHYIDCYIRVPQKSADLEQIARDVIAGKYGNGAERKKRLQAAGVDYGTVQALVNKILKG